MNIVAVKNETNHIYESQSCNVDNKNLIKAIITQNLIEAKVADYIFREMSDNELDEMLNEH